MCESRCERVESRKKTEGGVDNTVTGGVTGGGVTWSRWIHFHDGQNASW